LPKNLAHKKTIFPSKTHFSFKNPFFLQNSHFSLKIDIFPSKLAIFPKTLPSKSAILLKTLKKIPIFLFKSPHYLIFQRSHKNTNYPNPKIIHKTLQIPAKSSRKTQKTAFSCKLSQFQQQTMSTSSYLMLSETDNLKMFTLCSIQESK
jgi:hypothetical protein